MERAKTPGLIVLAGVLAVAACQPRPSGQAEGTQEAAVDTVTVLASVDSLRSAYQDAVASADTQALISMVAEGARLVGAGGAAWDSAMAAAGQAPFPPDATLEISPMETRVLTEDWVYEMGTGVLRWTPAGADSARSARDTYLVILHRTEDGWKVYREVASSRPPPEAGM